MCTRATTTTGKRVGLRSAWLLGIVMILLYSPAVWATTYLKNQDIELQSWYRMRQSFQTDSTEHFDWVGWRNEAFIWGIWHNFVKDGQLLDRVPIPFVHNAEINARYQARLDPVYYLREHYHHLYDANQRSDFFKPQDLFRDLFVDLDHGDVGPGSLSSRWGYQTIVWGEMDLFRSLDVINPLRVDQSFVVGEKLDEIRLPILAVKFLYNLGSIGESFSEMGIEGWFTPRYMPSNSHTDVILEETFRAQFQLRDCMTPDGKVHHYSPENCATARKFLPMRPGWLGQRRIMNPWSVFPQFGPSAINQAGDFVCVDYKHGICQPDLPDERISLIGNIVKRKTNNVHKGVNFPGTTGGGVRLLGKTWFNLDFSLVYIFQPTGLWGWAFPKNPTKVYGDFPFAGIQPSGTFAEGLRQCLSEDGSVGVGRRSQTHQTTILTGADLRGYDWPERRLDANGAPLPSAKQKQAARLPITFCAPLGAIYKWNHIMGFSLTYNDSDYTGAVFRLEESVTNPAHWHKDIANPGPANAGGIAAKNHPKVLYEFPEWRHGLGMDLLQSFGSYPGMGWMRNLPGGLGGFAKSGQALVLQWQTVYRPEMSNSTDPGTGAEGLMPRLIPPVRPGKPRISFKHWNHVFTVVTAGGYKKYEQRIAFVYEPRAKQTLFFAQVFWHGFMSPHIDLSTGLAMFMGSRNDDGWTFIQNYAHRDLLWFEFTYYLL